LAEFDVYDEAIIYAKPEVVYKALLTEFSGETHWWMPYFEAKPRQGGAADQLGTLIDITIHSNTSLLRFTGKTVEVKENELLRVEYIEGDFLGEGIWKLEPSEENTKLSFRWHCRPARLLFKILAPLINIPKRHSAVMKSGFEGLNKYIKENADS
jgi:hypothetical protein